MADEFLHVKQEEDPLFLSGNSASNTTSFHLSAVRVKVENEFVSEEGDPINVAGVGSTVSTQLPEQTYEESKFSGHSVVADESLHVKQEEDPLFLSGHCASNPPSNLSAVKVNVEQEFALKDEDAVSVAGNGTRGIKTEPEDVLPDDLKSSVESMSICTKSGQFVNVFIKEEDLEMYAEEEERSNQVNKDSCISFEGEASCYDDKVFPKTEINHEVYESDELESCFQEAAVSSSVNSGSSFPQQDKNGTLQSQPFQCSNRSAKLQTKSLLKKQKVCDSNEKPFSCTQCPSKFKHRKHLNYHLSIHSDERPFSCPHCSSKFKSKSNLTAHLVSHSDERSFSCPHCSSKFKTKSHLNTHLVTHFDEKPFSCPRCSCEFKRKQDLSQHLISHSDERPFSCPHCSCKFKRKQDLNQHLVSHSDEQSFSCPHCSSRFKFKSHLKRHLLTHSDEQPFSCPHCSFKCKLKSNLNRHLGTHSVDRPFSCPHCVSKFKSRSALNQHLVIHSDQPPFSCSHCLSRFKSKTGLKKHVLVHMSVK